MAKKKEVFVAQGRMTKGSDERNLSATAYGKVKTFSEQPAKAFYSLGATVNMGNYESIRIHVGVELPSLPKDVIKALHQAKKIAEAEIASEVPRYRAQSEGVGIPEIVTFKARKNK